MNHIISALVPDAVKNRLRPAYTKFRSQLYHSRFTNAHVDLPTSLNLAVTFKCLSACPHCYFLQIDNKTFQGEKFLSDELYDDILNSEFSTDITSLGCGGGEALQHPKLFEWIDKAHAKGIPNIQVVTNGVSLQDETIMEKVLQPNPVTNFLISLDAVDEAAYKQAKGLKKTNFNLVLDNIRRIVKARKPGSKMVVGVSFVVSAENVSRSPEMLDLAHSLGVDYCHFTTLQLTDEGNAEQLGETLLEMPREYQEIMAKSDYDLDISIQPALDGKNSKYWCAMLASQLPIDTTGRIAPCCHIPWDEKYGRFEDFTENPINNPMTVAMREQFIAAADADDPALLPTPCQLCNRRLSGCYSFQKSAQRWDYLYY